MVVDRCTRPTRGVGSVCEANPGVPLLTSPKSWLYYPGTFEVPRVFFCLSRLLFPCGVWYAVIMQLKEHNEHVDLLRYMLAELMVKQNRLTLTEEQRTMHKKGIKALRAAVDAMNSQVYA